jgi:hypothetical protein
MNRQPERIPGRGGRSSRGRGEASSVPSSSGRIQTRIQSNSGEEKTRENRRDSSAIPSSGVPYGHVPSYLPGSASLVEQLDKKLMIILRDGRHLVGVGELTRIISVSLSQNG